MLAEAVDPLAPALVQVQQHARLRARLGLGLGLGHGLGLARRAKRTPAGCPDGRPPVSERLTERQAPATPQWQGTHGIG